MRPLPVFSIVVKTPDVDENVVTTLNAEVLTQLHILFKVVHRGSPSNRIDAQTLLNYAP